MIKCIRKFEFDAAHRVVGHGGKCRFLHGHRYILEVTIVSNHLDELGMVIDFGEIKDKVKSWVDKHFDHNIILWKNDARLGQAIKDVTEQDIYYLATNPTAENIALHLKNDILPQLFIDSSYIIDRVKLYETPNCFVEVQ